MAERRAFVAQILAPGRARFISGLRLLLATVSELLPRTIF